MELRENSQDKLNRNIVLAKKYREKYLKEQFYGIILRKAEVSGLARWVIWIEK